MSVWRRKAIEAFPELRRQLNDKEEIFSINALWFLLLPLIRTAHHEGNDELLRRIYDFADWCRRQGGGLENAVTVSFYEHLFDEQWMRPLVAPRLSKQVIQDVHHLWEARLSEKEMREVDTLLAGR